MAYSLLFDARLIYYDEKRAENDDAVRGLQQADASQLALPSELLLAGAECYKKTDKAFIMSMFERNFQDTNEMVETIKTVIRRRMHNGLLLQQHCSGSAGVVNDGTSSGERSVDGSSTGRRLWLAKWSRRNTQQKQEALVKIELADLRSRRRSSGAPSDSRTFIRQISKEKAKMEGRSLEASELEASEQSSTIISRSQRNDGFYVSPLHYADAGAEELSIDISAPSVRDSSGNNSGLSVEEF